MKEMQTPHTSKFGGRAFCFALAYYKSGADARSDVRSVKAFSSATLVVGGDEHRVFAKQPPFIYAIGGLSAAGGRSSGGGLSTGAVGWSRGALGAAIWKTRAAETI